MKDFFRFRSELLEGKKEQKHKDKSKELTELDKDEDDPCWDGYVQLGTKMKNGKEVPNCVPKEEARKQMKNESAASYERDLDPNKKIVVKGNKGMNSKPFIKKFRNMKAADKWMDDNEDDVEIRQVMNESVLNEESDFKKGARVKIKNNVRDSIGKKYRGKSGTVVRTDGNFVDVKVDRARAGEVEFHKRELEPLTESALTEAKSVEVSVRDARKANDIASDMFRGEYKNDGSTIFIFKKADAADDFRAELEKQRIELLEETKPKSGDREAYKKFFNKALKKFGADSLADLDDDKQKEFFNYVDKNWESEDEKD